MKKIYLFYYLFLSMMLLTNISCSDDESIEDPKVDDPEKLVDPQPTTDQVAVKNNNKLFFLSPCSKGSESIAENMVNRYKEVIPYSSEVKMEVGDVFFFSNQDISKIQSDTLLLSEMKSMIKDKSIIMMMEGGTNEDMHNICTLLDCYNPYPKKQEEKDLHPEALPLWIFSGPLPSANGIFSKLVSTCSAPNNNTKESSIQVINEYGQGLKCDMLSQSLQEGLTPKPVPNMSSNLKDLAKAYIYTFQADETLPIQDYGKGSREGTNHYQVEAKIWNVYSKDQNRQFYLVNLGFMCNVQNTFFGEWHSTAIPQSKVYGWCLTNVNISFEDYNQKGAIIHEHSPQTTENETTYTSNVTLHIGGDVQIDGPKVTGDLTLSNTHTETINKINVVNKCSPIPDAPIMEWDFMLQEPTSHFDLFSHCSSKIEEGAKSGISSCSLSADFIFSEPDNSDVEHLWLISMQPTLQTFYFSDLAGFHEQTYRTNIQVGQGVNIIKLINLPTVKKKKNEIGL